jgi:DHA1 family tetracycline resistance protein-like MFS transporter
LSESNPRRPRKAATVFIFITIVLDVLAMGMVIPVMPQLFQQVGGGDDAHMSVIFGLFGTSWAVMQLISAPVQGALSDRFGRRPIILVSNFGMGLNYLLMAVSPNLAWLFVGRIVSGVCAGSIPAAMAYLADVNPPEKRAAGFGLLGAAFSLGFAIGPGLGGMLGALGPRAPFWAAAGLSLANAMYGLFVLPESLARERRAPLEIRHLNPVSALVNLLRTYPALGAMLAVSFLFSLAQQGPNNVFSLYAFHRYHWRAPDIGLMMTAFGVGGMIVQAGLVPLATKWLGDRNALLFGLTLQIGGLIMFALASTPAQFWLAVPVMSLGAVGGPAWSAFVSRQVSAQEQGRLAGATSSINSLTGIIAPSVFTFSFAAAIRPGSWLPLGVPFFTAAAFMAMAMAGAAFVMTRSARRLSALSA